MAAERVGGILFLKVDGVQYKAKGNFTYNIGQNKRESVVGVDGVHGYKETPQAPKLEGAITDGSGLDLEAFLNLTDVTATLELYNGKVIVFRNAYYVGDGNVTTEEGEIEAMFEAISAEEIQ